MKNKFLEKVAEQIEDERSRKLITAELESHLLDKIDYYVDIGYSKEEAEKRATEEMGNPDDTAVPLNALHNNNFRDLLSFICKAICNTLVSCSAIAFDNSVNLQEVSFVLFIHSMCSLFAKKVSVLNLRYSCNNLYLALTQDLADSKPIFVQLYTADIENTNQRLNISKLLSVATSRSPSMKPITSLSSSDNVSAGVGLSCISAATGFSFSLIQQDLLHNHITQVF